MTEATDVSIHLVSRFGAKECSGEESGSKSKIDQTSRAGFETVDSAEDVFYRKTRESGLIVLCFVKGGGHLPAKVVNMI